eukprot:14139039-Heterocapsa_arctica.AAC.1
MDQSSAPLGLPESVVNHKVVGWELQGNTSFQSELTSNKHRRRCQRTCLELEVLLDLQPAPGEELTRGSPR